MNNGSFAKVFNDMGGEVYDKNNTFFRPVHNNLQFLNALVLKDMPERARILCVGVGTGADLIDLALQNPKWNFVGIDPAESMLKTCKQKLIEKGIEKRCNLFHGYLADYRDDNQFDAVLCLYVMHFVKDINTRSQMYRDMAKLLNERGRLVTSEICVATDSDEYPGLLENWKALHALAGTPKEKLDEMGKLIEEQLAVLSPAKTKSLISENGFESPVSFFKSFLITGHWANKSSEK